MSMQEEVLKLAEECGFEFFKATKYESETLANRAGHNIEAFERFYRAAYLAGAKAMQEEAAKKRAGKPRDLKPCGTGAFLSDHQYCFDKGHKEGAKAVRDAIRAINPENLK